MLFNALVLLLLVFVAYMWVLRGFFSALIHLVCTVIAGAVAFGVWEPLSYWILESAPTSGVGSHLTGMAWGIGLIVPFGLTLAILRLVVDKMLPANVVISQQLNYVGGGLCGILAGVLTAGIVAPGLSFFRIPEFSPSLRYANQGNLERAGALWVPVDKLTGRFYGMLSETSFRTSEPLARWHPFVHEEGGSLQLSAFEGKNRNTTRPSDFDVVARFQVGEPGKANFASLLTDQWHPGVTQKVRDLDGNDFPANTHIEMFVVNFKAGAKEKEGKVSVGSAQVRLLLENQEGERMVVHLDHPVTARREGADATVGVDVQTHARAPARGIRGLLGDHPAVGIACRTRALHRDGQVEAADALQGVTDDTGLELTLVIERDVPEVSAAGTLAGCAGEIGRRPDVRPAMLRGLEHLERLAAPEGLVVRVRQPHAHALARNRIRHEDDTAAAVGAVCVDVPADEHPTVRDVGDVQFDLAVGCHPPTLPHPSAGASERERPAVA